jgi:hypothetical protein
MTARRSTSSSKKERAIPVTVTIDTRPRADILPPEPVTPEPQPTPSTSIKNVVRKAQPTRALRQPVHEWPEARRRQLMWWLVAGGATLAIISWLAFLRFDGAAKGQNIFAEAIRLLKNVEWPSLPASSQAEQEIRQLDQQVFPQFTQ